MSYRKSSLRHPHNRRFLRDELADIFLVFDYSKSFDRLSEFLFINRKTVLEYKSL